MIRPLLSAGLGALSVCASALPALAAPILPGLWESTDTITSPFQQTKTSRKCITPEQIKSYLTGPVNNHYSCRYKDKKIGDGTFSMVGDCVDNSGLPAKVAVHGVYTDTSFSMTGRLRIVLRRTGHPGQRLHRRPPHQRRMPRARSGRRRPPPAPRTGTLTEPPRRRAARGALNRRHAASCCLTRSARILMSRGLGRKVTPLSPSSRSENSASA